MILSIPPHQWSMVVVVSWRGHVLAASELVLCIYWWCDCWQKQQDEFWSVSGNIICSYSAKCFRTHWMALHSADGQWPKAYCKSNQRVFEGKEWTVMQCQVNHLTWIRLSMHFTCWRQTEGKMPQEQAGTEDGCSRGLAEHHQGWNPASGDVYAFQTSGCKLTAKVFATKYYKSEKFWFMIIICPIYFWSLNKWEAHMQTVVILHLFTWFGCKYLKLKWQSAVKAHLVRFLWNPLWCVV